MAKTDFVQQHIERCIELYGQPIDEQPATQPVRQGYEQMRADLMLALGMLSALDRPELPPPASQGRTG